GRKAECDRGHIEALEILAPTPASEHPLAGIAVTVDVVEVEAQERMMERGIDVPPPFDVHDQVRVGLGPPAKLGARQAAGVVQFRATQIYGPEPDGLAIRLLRFGPPTQAGEGVTPSR